MGYFFTNSAKSTTAPAPLRYDIVGSFLRPQALKEARLNRSTSLLGCFKNKQLLR
ncbi:hypothetical protein SAMN02745123_00996 [Desulforamulus aeronauticus DSM 10349]|uniref:5-methyltetrahydropteroyltriglutamate--homocysteine methyltransferase n=1 Tax=Desulforamulus aeronauticus DSM 10349 TaxID=1121421 RepID=A0A1M6QEE8_9FIRM|nr:hypothetical protein SAMN02745123_00996 [Desulforamulus aeronauticus DSM 10349]